MRVCSVLSCLPAIQVTLQAVCKRSDWMNCEYLACVWHVYCAISEHFHLTLIKKVDTSHTTHIFKRPQTKGRNENPATPGPHARRVVLWPVKPKVQGSTGVRGSKGDCSWRRARAACWWRRARGPSRPRISRAGAGPRRRGAIAALYMSSKTTLAATVLACSAMALKTSSRSVKALS